MLENGKFATKFAITKKAFILNSNPIINGANPENEAIAKGITTNVSHGIATMLEKTP